MARKTENEKINLPDDSFYEAKKSFFGQATVRVGFLLLIVLVIFALVRDSLIPVSFGQYGRFRGDSIQENVALAAMYADSSETCRKCHQAIFNEYSAAQHAGIDCQTCHGAGEMHNRQPGEYSLKIGDSTKLCASCHTSIAGRSDKQISTVNIFIHSGGVDCLMCHNPHSPLGGRSS